MRHPVHTKLAGRVLFIQLPRYGNISSTMYLLHSGLPIGLLCKYSQIGEWDVQFVRHGKE